MKMDEKCFDELCHSMQVVNFSEIDPTFGTFDVDIIDEEYNPDIPEERLLKDAVLSPYRDFFLKKNEKSFSELSSEMQPIENGSGILKKIVREGHGPTVGEKGSAVIHYQLFVDGELESVDSTLMAGRKPLDISLGQNVLPGIEISVNTMRFCEVAHFIIPSNLAFGKHGLIGGRIEKLDMIIPPDADIFAEIEILQIKTLQFEEKVTVNELTFANELIASAKAAYAAKKFSACIRYYQRALDNLHAQGINTTELNELVLKINVNLAVVFNKIGQPKNAIKRCLLVLEKNPIHMKAMFHLGRGYMLDGNFEAAKTTLLSGSRIYSNSKDFHSEIRELNERMKK